MACCIACTARHAATIVVAIITLLPAAAEAEARPEPGWRNSVTAAYAWQGKAELGEQDSFRAERGILQYEASRQFGRRWGSGVSVGYGEDRYDFDATGVGFSPWGDIRSLEFSVPVRYLADNKWALFGLPVLRYSAERGSSLGDGREYGLIAGASYRFSSRLTVGPGLGGFAGIGNEDDLFPVLFINWRITETLSLETGRGLAATRGPGLALRWRPTQGWAFSIAARYEKFRFRLADAAASIGEDKSVPIVATANWRLSPIFDVSALVGAETAGNLRVEDDNGNIIVQRSYDTAPLAALVLSARF